MKQTSVKKEKLLLLKWKILITCFFDFSMNLSSVLIKASRNASAGWLG